MKSLCLEAAREIHNGRAPSPQYAYSVGDLLYGTGMVESGYKTRRQYGFQMFSTGGAFSYWQLEKGSIATSLEWLRSRPEAARRSSVFLYGQQTDFLDHVTVNDILHLLRCYDRAGVLFCRLHYLRIPEPVPSSKLGQAQYWKKWYNTYLGAGTAEKYMEANQ